MNLLSVEGSLCFLWLDSHASGASIGTSGLTWLHASLILQEASLSLLTWRLNWITQKQGEAPKTA